MSKPPVKVTISDPNTGAVLDEAVLANDYVVVCSGDRYVASTQVWPNGTHVLTIKRRTTK